MSEFSPEKLPDDANTLGVRGLQERIDALMKAYPELGLGGVRRVLRLPEVPTPGSPQRSSSAAASPELATGTSRGTKGPSGRKGR